MSTKTLMIVDDSRVSRMMIKTYVDFKCPDWNLVEAATGEAAIELAATTNIDYCTMDINMPGMLGTDAAEILFAKYPNIRIAIFSANVQESNQTRAAELGAVFVAKPVTETSMAQALRHFDSTK